MTNTAAPAVSAAQLTAGTVIRFQPSILSPIKLTIRLTKDADVQVAGDAGKLYAVMFAYRVRPADHDVSFGNLKVYCSCVERIEILRAAS